MGYSYVGRKLCCDYCGKPGARKMRCPFGNCPAPAACPECRKTHRQKFIKAAHIAMGCDEQHNAYMAELKKTADMKAAGEFIRCSALGVEGKGVHVLFAGQSTTIGFYMPTEVYRAIPLGVIATPADYSKLGDLTPAPSDFHHGA
jgi:hypothetical protein